MSEGYLLDTSVLSVLAPGKTTPDAALAAWLRLNSDKLYISAITVAEVEQGICKLRRAGGDERAERLTQWLDTLIAQGATRILALDAQVGRTAGALSDQAVSIGRHPGFADVAIAATAKVHGLTVLTRNGRHFEPLGVRIVDPLDRLPR
ncbi:MAG: type II toxin-antitoxin system VapC family toxin [Pseudomonadota bacterium]